jgi:nucleoside-diphosphate-sugar epimerase
VNRVLVTGANGFIGRALCERLLADGISVRAAVRDQVATAGERVIVGDLAANPPWDEALGGVDVVVHLAGRAHVLRETAADPLAAFLRDNVEGTARLGHACVSAGVRRLVFVSSIKVNGEATYGRPFTEGDEPSPRDAYGQSKLEAETALRRICSQADLELVIVRPCLVYGPGVGGNVRRLLQVIDRGLPLPFGAIHNQRSLIGLENLCDLLLLCAREREAAGHTFLASDGRDLATPELVRLLAAGLGGSARLLSVPVVVLEAMARLTGRMDACERVCGSLQVDSTKARTLLGWRPPVTPEDGLRRTGADYRLKVR